MNTRQPAGVRQVRQAGFTIVEMVVALGLFALSTIVIVGMLAVMQQAQRSERYLDLANTAARTIVEEARNGGYDLLVTGTTYDRTSLVSDTLPGRSASMAVSASSGFPDIKRIEVTVSYQVGSLTRSVNTTALIGQGGIAP